MKSLQYSSASQAVEILQSMAEPEPQPHLKKKEKRELKREHLLQSESTTLSGTGAQILVWSV
jgi:hypothetical protein